MKFREHSSPWKIAFTSIVAAPVVAFLYLPWKIFTSWPVVIAGLIIIATVLALMTVLEERGPSYPERRRFFKGLYRSIRGARTDESTRQK